LNVATVTKAGYHRYTLDVDRVNSVGIRRQDLLWALGQPHVVRAARKRDSCLLCRAKRVNEAGLCGVCVTILSEAELRLAERWMSGSGP
jgi:hypothetical protein